MRCWASLAARGVFTAAAARNTHTTTITITDRARYSTPGKVTVHVKNRDGSHCDAELPVGISLMQALRDVAKLDVPGSCDGELECCTCHVYLSEASYQRAGEPSEEEEDLLGKALGVRETSRLACQVEVTPELDGLEVELPNLGGGI